MMKKRMLILSFVLCFALTLVGCGDKQGYTTYTEKKAETLKSGAVCENEKFELQWDQKNKRVILYDKVNEIRLSNTPEGELDNNPIESGAKTHPQVDSPIYVTYFDNVNFAEKTAYAATGSVKKGGVSVKEIEDGLSVTYNFKSEKFSVTVDYKLRDDNLLVSIDTSKITECAENSVTEITVAPFFCSVKNNSENSYLFVPSGSGALIYPDVKLSNSIVTSEKVYGYDYSVDSEANFVQYESVKLPVYGAVNQNKGVCAIVEEGAEGANICTISNNTGMGYAAVYASFLTRGYDLINTPQGFASTALKNKLYSEPIKDQVYSVAYYPFYDDNASYVNMANIYRSYLEETYDFADYKSAVNEQAINLNIIGGAECRDFIFGIPYNKIYATATLDEAKNIIDEIRELVGDLNVSLEGYTESGINIGKPAGDISIASNLGSYKELSKLFETYAETGTSLFLDFDSVCFSESGSGISPIFNAAVTTNGKQSILTVKSQETGLTDISQNDFRLVSREKLESLNSKILKKALKNKVYGIGLNTLSNMAYADYNNKNYYVALGMGEQVSNIFKTYRSNNIAVMGKSANAYAAVHSDYVAEVPSGSSGFDSFDIDIPFYEIVFKGYIPMSLSALNLSSNQNSILLKSLETGVGISFTIIENYNNELMNSMNRDFYGMNKNNVLSQIQKLSNDGVYAILKDLEGAKIASHSVISEYVRKTVFNNGITVYVNYGDEVYSDEELIIEANDYKIER